MAASLPPAEIASGLIEQRLTALASAIAHADSKADARATTAAAEAKAAAAEVSVLA